MSVDDAILAICEDHNFEFGPSLEECQNQFEPDYSNYELRVKIREIIKNRVPYTLYGLEILKPSYDQIKEIVKQMDGTRPSHNEDFVPVMYLNFDEVRNDLKTPMKTAKSTILRTGRTGSVYPINYRGYPINISIKHLTIFRNDVCQCDICGIKSRFVTIDMSPKININKITVWVVNHENVPTRMTVDHKIARGLGGTNHFNNTVAMCESCNNKKSSIESKIANHNRDVEKLGNAKLYPFEANLYRRSVAVDSIY